MGGNQILAVCEQVVGLLSSLLSPAETPSTYQGFASPGGGRFASENLTDEAVVSAVVALEDASRLITSLSVELAGEVVDRTSTRLPDDPDTSLAHRLGYPTAKALLVQATGASNATITRRLRIANVCRKRSSLHGEKLPAKFDALGEQFFGGNIHLDSVDLIASKLNALPPAVDPERVELAERVLASYASGSELVPGLFEDPLAEAEAAHSEQRDAAGDDPQEGDTPQSDTPQSDTGGGLREHAEDIRIRTGGWIAALDQEGHEPKGEQVDHRFLQIGSLRNGLVSIRGALVPEVAAGLGRLFDAINNPRSKPINTADDAEVAGEASGSEPPTVGPDGHVMLTQMPQGPETAAQRRHDALAAIVQVALRHHETPQLGGQAVSLVIQAQEEELLKPNGNAWLINAHGETSWISSAAARHASCAGGVLRVQQAANGQIIELESQARVFTAHQRKAIVLRDGGCIIPGCVQSAIWCEIHHVHEHAQGGATHTDNGVLLCWFHHRYLEHHGWQIRMRKGVPQVKAPPWLDPYDLWRPARSVHKPPELGEPPQDSQVSDYSEMLDEWAWFLGERSDSWRR